MILACLSMPGARLYAEAAPANLSKLAEVLGSGEAWKITPPEYVLSGEVGQTTLAALKGQTLVLESKASVAAPTECLVSFRLDPELAGWSNVNLQLARAERADKTQQSLTYYVTNSKGQNYVSYGVSVEGGKPPPPVTGVLYFDAVSDRSLGWSEEMRKSIEAQIAAAPKVTETLLTIRCTVEQGRFRIWLNGRFMSELPLEADMNPSGSMRILAYPGAELISVRVNPLPTPGLTRHHDAGSGRAVAIQPGKILGAPVRRRLRAEETG